MSTLSRCAIFAAAMLIQSLGVALTVKGALGISPISSVPYALSLSFPFTIGDFTFALNMLMLLGQIVLLRSKFKPYQLLQIPATLLFAYGIDFFMVICAPISPTYYIERLALLLGGASCIALSVALQGIADVLMCASVGLIYAICHTFDFELGRVKTAFDVVHVIAAVAISLTWLGTIAGIREGTLISALITGSIARFFLRHLGAKDAAGRPILAPHV